MGIKSSKNKKTEPAASTTTFIKKKLRSKRPRRRRSHITPFILQKQTTPSGDSSSCYYFDADEYSCDSSRVSNPKKRKFVQIQGGYGAKNQGKDQTGDSQFRRIFTRSYYKKKREAKGNEAEVSESSCVESNSGADFRVFGERSSKVKKTSENLKENEKNDAVSDSLDPVARSDISCVELIPHEISEHLLEKKENDLISVTPGFEFCSTSKSGAAVFKENINDVVDANYDVPSSESVVDQTPKSFSGLDSSHLACDEQFSLAKVVSDYSWSHETAFSELQSDLFPETSDSDFSDCTPSDFFDSGSQFSEKLTLDAPTSLTYFLFLEFKQQFTRFSCPLDLKSASRAEDERQLNHTLVRFEGEETYKRLTAREIRQVILRDHAEKYRYTTVYDKIRLHSFIIDWIVEQCTAKDFQQETKSLGLSLLNRFMSKGYLKNGRSFPIVGIACLALAIRIEENQPYESAQQNFYIGSNTYSRNEVVAMEWLVMGVLNFQYFLPIENNFLWFHMKAAEVDAEVKKRAMYQLMLTLTDLEQLRYWSSTVARGLKAGWIPFNSADNLKQNFPSFTFPKPVMFARYEEKVETAGENTETAGPFKYMRDGFKLGRPPFNNPLYTPDSEYLFGSKPFVARDEKELIGTRLDIRLDIQRAKLWKSGMLPLRMSSKGSRNMSWKWNRNYGLPEDKWPLVKERVMALIPKNLIRRPPKW